MALLQTILDSVKDARRRALSREVPLDKLLLGPDQAPDELAFANATGDWLHTSTRLIDGPHVALLRATSAMSDQAITDAFLRSTPYFAYAMRCERGFGRFFEATDEQGMLAQCWRFITMSRTGKGGIGGGSGSGSGAGSPRSESRSRSASTPTVRAIQGSDMLQVRDGHHRLAAAAARGERTARVYLKTRPTQTAMQRLLLQVEMTKQRPELYQPLNLPELGAGWPLWRRCDDRWEMMLKFMGERGILPPGGGGEARTACDIACSYGWFVARYREAGFRARGIDVDPAAVKVGHICYGNTPQETGAQDAVAFLRAVQKPYDVMSCFSLAHHFVLGRGPCSAEELLRLLDKATGRVLFFDSGQNHERWFKDKLPEWDVEKLDRWLRETTSFREVVRLGVDRDDVGVGEGNYRRMLFALIR